VIKYFFFLNVVSLFFFATINAQNAILKPGFDIVESREMLYIAAISNVDTTFHPNVPPPERFKMVYRSKVLGIDNRWDLWINQNIAVISIRGTTNTNRSWLANGFSAMLPAKGTLTLNDNQKYDYELATHPEASVHAGWLICSVHLYQDIFPKIDSLYKSGIRDFVITGHSQGGVVANLLTSLILHDENLPKDIQFKTYASAAPKPGNLNYAYEYESRTQLGWSYNVVNAADWVPESPNSIQTSNDYNTTNPFSDFKSKLKNEKPSRRLILKYVYNRLNKPAKKSQKNHRKYLGKKTMKLLKIESNSIPEFSESIAYTRAGNTIVLYPSDAYKEKFKDTEDDLFVHHFLKAYLFLLNELEKNHFPSK
jgi:hypothetical protein